MKKILINYAHNGFYQSQERNIKTGLEIGGFTDSIKYNFKNLDDLFVKKNHFILSQPRGAGYWLWKPYVILKTLKQMNENDILMYSDAAIDFIDNMDEYINLCMDDERGVLLFLNNEHLNHTWTKRDCFVLMGLDAPDLSYEKPCGPLSRQLSASIQICKKTKFSLNFYEEYLRYCEDPRVLTDMPNTQGKANYPDFKDHRHDQSVLSLLKFKYDVLAKENICQFGTPYRKEHEKQKIYHHRLKS